MGEIATSILVVIASYMLGSISFSLVVGKLKGVDIRQHGSGNAGATNTLRVIGIGPALVVFVLDMLKGVLAVLLAHWFVPDNGWLAVGCGIAAIAGHNWPLWFRFKGGKGIATTIGIVVALAPLAGVIAGAVAIVAIALTRYVSLGSLVFTLLLPVCGILLHNALPFVLGSLLIMALAWYRHRTNIAKLLKGQEHKLGAKRKAQHS